MLPAAKDSAQVPTILLSPPGPVYAGSLFSLHEGNMMIAPTPTSLPTALFVTEYYITFFLPLGTEFLVLKHCRQVDGRTELNRHVTKGRGFVSCPFDDSSFICCS